MVQHLFQCANVCAWPETGVWLGNVTGYQERGAHHAHTRTHTHSRGTGVWRQLLGKMYHFSVTSQLIFTLLLLLQFFNQFLKHHWNTVAARKTWIHTPFYTEQYWTTLRQKQTTSWTSSSLPAKWHLPLSLLKSRQSNVYGTLPVWPQTLNCVSKCHF